MSNRLNIERAAQALVDSLFMTDREAIEKNGISRQSLLNYRQRIKPEHQAFTPELLHRFTFKLNEARQKEGWADHLTAPIRKAIGFIIRACEELRPDNPESVKAVTGALEVLVMADLTRKVIDQRLYGNQPGDDASAHPAHRTGAGQVHYGQQPGKA